MAATEKEIRRSVRAVRSSVRGRVHKSVLVRVDNLCTLIERLLPRLDELGAGSQEAHALTRTATAYLPAAINPYLALPREYAERVPQTDGRTAVQILCAQLDTLYAQLWQVYDAVMRRDGDRLLANERFLDDKFGRSTLDLPPGVPPSASVAGAGPRQRGPRGGSSGARRTKAAAGTGHDSDGQPLSDQLVHAAVQQLMDLMRSRKKPR